MKTSLLFGRAGLRVLFLLVSLFLTGLQAFSQKIYFVTPAGGAVKDGSTWANAFDGSQLQAAIETAATYSQNNGNQEVQVWVAAGTYKPTTGNDRSAGFSLRNNVAVYGGFEGDEGQLSERPAVNLTTPSLTTLSGEIGAAGNTDNSYHVVANLTLALTTSAILDGFIITAGNANGFDEETFGGGGMANRNASPTVRNCLFTGNAGASGGAVYNQAHSGGTCSPVFTDCRFFANTASTGAGMFNEVSFAVSCNPVITHCDFIENKASLGGALHNGLTGGGACSPVVSRCTFSKNEATNNSGAIDNEGGSPVITNCLFSGNKADKGGVAFNYTNPSYTNCTFTGNTAAEGAVIYNSTTGIVTFRNCIIWNNGGSNTFNKDVAATYSLFDTGVTYVTGSGNLTTATTPFISDTDFQLTNCSPAADAGDPAATTGTSGPVDLAGNNRFFNGGRIDIGAYELQAVCSVGPVAGSFDGYINGADCESFRGWVWNRDKPNTVVSVDILDGDNLLTTIPAGDFRQDLLDAGKGNGKHAFRFVLPESLKDGQPHTLKARVAGGSFVLKDSPKALVCQTSPVPPGNKPPVPPTPSVLVAVPLVAQVNVPFQATLPAFTDPEGGSLTYALAGLPAGLSLDASSRVVSGTPTQAGTFLLTYSATDGPGATNSVSFNLIVNPEGGSPVTGDFEGYLDKADCGGIRGWVWDRKKPNTPLTVELYTETGPGSETVLASMTANAYRQDLKNAGKGNGAHAFSFSPPGGLTGGTAVKVRVLGSGYVLKGAPKTFQCGSGRLSAETAPEVHEAHEAHELKLVAKGNPIVGDRIEVEVTGAEGQPLQLLLTDGNGRPLGQRSVERAAGTERQTLEVGRATPGILVLRGISGSRSVALKLIKP
ncbi:putative Ig domain-containing protein [Larkinella soli]|uniref:putative Ig domain-containing protein n=1 Tax=Larkinella soli TaxID=1770527 RepID=UPI000FFC51A4|nr:putative Ig domain-containing protein [Larkinella soli]